MATIKKICEILQSSVYLAKFSHFPEFELVKNRRNDFGYRSIYCENSWIMGLDPSGKIRTLTVIETRLMIGIELVRQVALSFPETTEQAHFEKPSFKAGKKIFATYNCKENRVCVKLSEMDQDLFSAFDRSIIFPVPNKWGKQGWTLINLLKVPEETLIDALTSAYCEVAPRKLSAIVIESRSE